MFMKRTFYLTVLCLMMGANLYLAVSALAAPPPPCPIEPDSFANYVRRAACRAGFIQATEADPVSEETIAEIIGRFIGIALGFAGVVFVVIVLYGGWLWGTARGNEEQVQYAEKLIRNAVLGIIVVFAVFTISRFVINAIDVGVVR